VGYIWVIIGLVYANCLEWALHRYVLHGLGKTKGTIWSFHFHGHHKISRKNKGVDLDYKTWGFKKENMFLLILLLVHLPTLLFSYSFFFTLSLYTFLYYFMHRKSHLDAGFCRTWMPWHWDHHMGRDQDANWCVLFPLADYVFRTRVKYVYNDDHRAIDTIVK
jgi:hypothetical protein